MLEMHERIGRRLSGRGRWQAASLVVAALIGAAGSAQAGSPPLTKYVDPLPIPAVLAPVATGAVTEYEVNMEQVTQQLHSELPGPTTLWTYNGVFPGPTFETRRGEIVQVTWSSTLPDHHILPVDDTLPDTLHGEPEVRTVVHRHGGLQDGIFDGGPDDWFTPGFGEVGPTFPGNVYYYPNDQPAATLWYHDHAAGVTRLNVYAGLAGFWIVRDDEEDTLGLPSGGYEIPIVIQDRTFNEDGSLFYPSEGRWRHHPVWVKHFLGDTAVVNGKVWPYLEVEPRKYRFRLLNGSNSRLYNLYLSNGQHFYQIGTDTGLMARPVRIDNVNMDPGERADIVIDFRGREGQTIRLLNGEFENDPDLPEIMEFRVSSTPVGDPSRVPNVLAAVEPYDPDDALVTRVVTVEMEEDESGDPVAMLLDGKYRHEAVTEIAKAGSIEVWRIANLTSETHPIHLHLSDFQVLSRQELDSVAYHEALMSFRDGVGPEPVLEAYLGDEVNGPEKYERGNKDTVQAHGESLTTVVVKFGEYTGDVVWHCHILEHEDNDMMRPLRVIP